MKLNKAVCLYDTDEDTYPPLPKRPNVRSTRLFIPGGSLTKVLRDIVTMRPVVSHYHNFMKGLQMNNAYLDNDDFCMWKGNSESFHLSGSLLKNWIFLTIFFHVYIDACIQHIQHLTTDHVNKQLKRKS